MTDTRLQTTTLGGGCFWCIDAVFRELRGVESVVSGYAGGRVPNPTYREVCSGRTGHAEVVQVTFDPNVISIEDLLRIFFTIHDPTTLNRQGYDVGTQYRSAIFYQDEDQRARAEAVMREFADSNVWQAPLVTELVPLIKFYPAEDYHQDYFRRIRSSNIARQSWRPRSESCASTSISSSARLGERDAVDFFGESSCIAEYD